MCVRQRMVSRLKSSRVIVLLATVLMFVAGPVSRLDGDTALNVKAQGPNTFYLDPAAGRNQISISSESALDDFTIVCNQVNGRWQFDPQHVERISGRFALRVANLKTGMDFRDKLLVGADWLNGAVYPEIQIEIRGGEHAKKIAPNTVSMLLHMRFTMHGVTRELVAPWSLTYLDESPKTLERAKGDLIRLRTQFEISLADFHVVGPPVSTSFIGLYVADRLPIRATVFGSTEPPLPVHVDASSASRPVY